VKAKVWLEGEARLLEGCRLPNNVHGHTPSYMQDRTINHLTTQNQERRISMEAIVLAPQVAARG